MNPGGTTSSSKPVPMNGFFYLNDKESIRSENHEHKKYMTVGPAVLNLQFQDQWNTKAPLKLVNP